MNSLLVDVRHAARRWRRHARFAAAAMILLALGIGANAGIFSVIRAVVLRPLPYPDPERLVALIGSRDGTPTPSGVMSAPDVADYGAQVPSFTAIGGVATTQVSLTDAGAPAATLVGRVTPGFFAALGIQPTIGRLPTRDDFTPSNPAVAVLGHALWSEAFGRAPDVIGRTVRLNDRPVVVVGVLPADPLQYPSDRIALWIPLRSDDSRGSRNLSVVARLAPGASPESAGRDLRLVATRLAATYPETNASRSAVVRPLHDEVTGPTRPALLLIMAATGLVLLIACANLGHLLLAQATGRSAEFGVRIALGAGTRRLVQQLLVEGLMLAVPGALLALLLADWLATAFVTLSPVALPRGETIAIDGTVLAFTAAAGILTTLVAGLTPALAVRFGTRGIAAGAGGARAGAGRYTNRVGGGLVVTQVALSGTLLVGATLLLQSFVRLHRVEPGFDADRRLVFAVSLPGTRYPTAQARLGFFQGLERSLAELPGVGRVGAVSTLPLSGGNLCDQGTVEDGRPFADCVEFRAASPGYFAAMRQPLLAGRGLQPTDLPGAPTVAVVNETLARMAWPGGSPLGRRVDLVGETFTVVGVVGDVRQFGPEQPVRPELYAPVAQATLPWMAYVVETAGDPAAMVRVASAAVWELDPALPLREVSTYDRLLADVTHAQRARAVIVGALAAAALLLAMLGVYALLSYLVAARTREIGVRLALGASAGRVVREVLGRSVALVAVGSVAGAAGAFALSGLLRAFLFSTNPHNPTAYVIVTGGLVAAAIVAATTPARRAARIAPAEALRHE